MSHAAILFAGNLQTGMPADQNAPYANDLALWRRLLEQRFQVSAADMVFLYGEGGIVQPTVEQLSAFEARPATEAHLASALREVATRQQPSDLFFLVISNHGKRGADGGFLTLAYDVLVRPERLAEMCAAMPSQRQVFVFGQCGAGAFLPLASPHRAVLVGCMEDQGTLVRKDDDFGRTFQWTEFLYGVAAALGADPQQPASVNTLREAFEIAERHTLRRRRGRDGSWPELHDPAGLCRSL